MVRSFNTGTDLSPGPVDAILHFFLFGLVLLLLQWLAFFRPVLS